MKALKNRPQVHYFQFDNWMNDPNGLIVNNGVFHLFYQANPGSKEWGNIGWGHATSTDLIKWCNQPHALYASDTNMIFSGSAICSNKLLGYQEELVVFYTDCRYQYDDSGEFLVQQQTQCIAYSCGKGIEWHQHESNPIIDINSADFRDPKVIQLKEGGWLMLVSRARKPAIDFYTSDNLKHWHLSSSFTDCDFRAGAWECPDLVTIEIDSMAKSVLILSIDDGFASGGSGVVYIIGDFKNGAFYVDRKAMQNKDHIVLDKGPDFFAPQSFYNCDKDANAIILGWLNNWKYAKKMPDKNLPMLQSIPRVIGLKRAKDDSILLTQTPVSTLKQYVNKKLMSGNLQVSSLQSSFCKNLSGCFLLNILLAIEHKAAYHLSIDMDGECLLSIRVSESMTEVCIERSRSELFENMPEQFKSTFLPLNSDLDIKIIADHYSFEIFINQFTEVFSLRSHCHFDNLCLSHHISSEQEKSVFIELEN